MLPAVATGGRDGLSAPRSDRPSRLKAETLAAYGVPIPDIARIVGLNPKTLYKHYGHELDVGHIRANVKVAENLFNIATGETPQAVQAAIFWLRTRARWTLGPGAETQDGVLVTREEPPALSEPR